MCVGGMCSVGSHPPNLNQLGWWFIVRVWEYGGCSGVVEPRMIQIVQVVFRGPVRLHSVVLPLLCEGGWSGTWVIDETNWTNRTHRIQWSSFLFACCLATPGRAQIDSWFCIQDPYLIWGTLCGTRDQTQDVLLQGKCPFCCTIAAARNNLFLRNIGRSHK